MLPDDVRECINCGMLARFGGECEECMYGVWAVAEQQARRMPSLWFAGRARRESWIELRAMMLYGARRHGAW